MSEYLLLNIAIIIIPLFFSFEKKIVFYKKLSSLAFSCIIVGSIFIFWDSASVYLNVWRFNADFLSGYKILNLPIEEILFFITVPYSLLFLYETARYYLNAREIRINPSIYLAVSCLFAAAAFIYNKRFYTLAVFSLTSLIFLLLFLFRDSGFKIFNSNISWLWIAFSFIPFLAVNYILTSLPVVTYSSNAIIGIRFLTIPLEDFFYSFSMLSLYLVFYSIAERRIFVSVNKGAHNHDKS